MKVGRTLGVHARAYIGLPQSSGTAKLMRKHKLTDQDQASQKRTFVLVRLENNPNNAYKVHSLGPTRDEACDAIGNHIRSHRGNVIRTTDDSLLAVFSDVESACTCAISLKEPLRHPTWAGGYQVKPAVAIATGEDVRFGHDFYGDATHWVTKVAAIGHPGQILTSFETVESIAESKDTVGSIVPLGRYTVEGLRRLEPIFQISHIHDIEFFPALRAIQGVNTNISHEPTAFIGRTQELATVDTLMQRGRYLTLVGLGGVGKSRLATEWSRRQNYVDGCWIVKLADLTEPTLVAQSISRVLDVSENPYEPSVVTLCRALRPLRALLILDNCEHVLIQAAAVIERILSECPYVSVLATSRDYLSINDEKVLVVRPMECPGVFDDDSGEAVLQSDAFRLYADRAFGSRDDIDLSTQVVHDVAYVCRRLDGIPLAIELAAARLSFLPKPLIENRILSSVDVLDDENTRRPAGTMSSVINGIVASIGSPASSLLKRLTTFRSDFSVDAATSVCGFGDVGRGEVPGLLSKLERSSLISRTCVSPLRFRLLNTVQDVLLNVKPDDFGQEAIINHAMWAVDTAENLETQLASEKSKVVASVEAEMANFQLVMSRSLDVVRAEFGLRICAALYAYWILRGFFKEPLDWLMRLLEVEDSDVSDAVLAKSWSATGGIARAAGNLHLARYSFNNSLVIWERGGNQQGLADALNNLGIVSMDEGKVTEARSLLIRSLDFHRSSDDVQGMSACLINLGLLALATGTYELAYDQFLESTRLDRISRDEWGVATSLAGLGRAMTELNDADGARATLTESLKIRIGLQDMPGTIESVEALAMLDAYIGAADRAALMMGAAMSARTELSIPIPQSAKAKLFDTIRHLEQDLGRDRLSVLMRAGKSTGIADLCSRITSNAAGANT